MIWQPCPIGGHAVKRRYRTYGYHMAELPLITENTYSLIFANHSEGLPQAVIQLMML
jgi:hypothetical protein